MGCDIHVFAERLIDNKWEIIKSNIDYNDYQWSISRNYVLFGYLAGVRYPCYPISFPKGVPNDCSKEFKQISDDYSSDGHSHSFLSAKELLDSKKQKMLFYEVISLDKYSELLNENLIKYKTTNSYEDVISNIDADRLIKLSAFLDKQIFTHYVFEDTKIKFNPCDSDLYETLLPKLLQIEPDPEKIRIVFFFDN